MKLPVRSNRSRFDSTMTPMIDVVFLLLIFFVCTVSFQTLEGMLPTRLSTPQAAGVEPLVDPQLDELEPVIVKVMEAGGQLSWSVGQDWSATPTWTWTPAAPANYIFQVWVRNAGSGAIYDAYRDAGPATIGSAGCCGRSRCG